jgi:hypothetical protein
MVQNTSTTRDSTVTILVKPGVVNTINKYINAQSTQVWDSGGNHYYRLPVISLHSCSKFVTFDCPCTLCGFPQDSSLHKMVLVSHV